ncbi:response regulator transcription factor [Streptomyces sp. NPDC059605]|uniref:response regulator transcription factor n=1 Tax=unclassified Streptomyces TaxID=2593676 RepID=UPI0036C33A8F
MGERDLSAFAARRATLRVLPGGAPPAAPDAAGATATVRVYVLGTDALARSGIRALLDGRPAIHVVGDGEPGPACPDDITTAGPDVVLAHGTPDPGTLPPDCRLLTIGGPEPETGPGPAHSRLPGTVTAAQLASAVVLTAAGYTVAARPDGPAPTTAPGTGPTAPVISDVGPEQLTDRERQVLGLLAHGLTNTEIAGSLTLSEHTVKTHVQNLLGKLRLRNRVQAVVYAFEAGLRRPLSPSP